MAGEVVPFGKYKGEPVEVLLADQGYRDWLMSQDWFRSRFGNIYQTIINYGAEPQETPEHNQMQASFLDDDRCFKLAELLYPYHPFGRKAIGRDRSWTLHGAALFQEFKQYVDPQYEDATILGRKFEHAGWDVIYRVDPASLWLEVTSQPPCTCGDCDHAGDCPGNASCRSSDGRDHLCNHSGHGLRSIPTPDRIWWNELQRHCNKACPWSDEKKARWLLRDDDDDRPYERMYYRHVFQPAMPGIVRLELKPDLGDDFPAVLRQVTRYDHETGDRRCVLVRRSSFETVTWEQVTAIFAASGIVLLREARLEDASSTEPVPQPAAESPRPKPPRDEPPF